MAMRRTIERARPARPRSRANSRGPGALADHRLDLDAPPAAPAPPGLRRVLTLTDLLALALAWGFVGPALLGGRSLAVVGAIALALVLTPPAMMATGLYRSEQCAARLGEAGRVAVAGTVTTGALVALDRAAGLDLEPSSIVLTGAAAVLALLAGRSGFRSWVQVQRAAGRYARPIALVGQARELSGLATFYAEHPELGYVVRGAVTDDRGTLPAEVEWLGSYHDREALRAVAPIGAAVVAIAGLPSVVTNAVLDALEAEGIRVHLHMGLSPTSLRRLRSLPLAHEPLHYVASRPSPQLRRRAKRALDVVGASVGLVLCTPMLLAAAALVWLEDGASPIFRQRRVGLDGRVFTMMKLRTMRPDAEARRQEIIDLNERTGPLFKVDHDPRVTRVGRWLRELSIDELPQLLNVLRGEMSLVGPRPALPAETALFDAELHRRHEVRPGMTGLWQIEARDKPSIYAYRRLDLHYVDSWTIGGDVAILARTAASVLFRGVRRLLPTPDRRIDLVAADPLEPAAPAA